MGTMDLVHTENNERPWLCRFFGCRWDFGAEGSTLRWRCARCGSARSREYADPESAQRMAAALNRGGPRPPTGFLAALGGTLHRGDRRDE